MELRGVMGLMGVMGVIGVTEDEGEGGLQNGRQRRRRGVGVIVSEM